MSEIENESETDSRAIEHDSILCAESNGACHPDAPAGTLHNGPAAVTCSSWDGAGFGSCDRVHTLAGEHAYADAGTDGLRDELQRRAATDDELAELCSLYREKLPHSRHMLGRVHVTCPGVPELDAGELGEDEGTYVDMLTEYVAAQRHWIGPAQTPLVFHLRKLARRLDTDPAASASLSSAYLQAFSRLDRQRPGSKQPAGADGELPGQGSIFDELEG